MDPASPRAVHRFAGWVASEDVAERTQPWMNIFRWFSIYTVLYIYLFIYKQSSVFFLFFFTYCSTLFLCRTLVLYIYGLMLFFFNNVACYKWRYVPTSRVWLTVHEHVQWHRRRWEVHTKDLNCWSINLLWLGSFIDGIYVDSPWWNPSFPYFSDKSPKESLRVYGKLMGIGVTSLRVYKFQGFVCLLYPLVNIYITMENRNFYG